MAASGFVLDQDMWQACSSAGVATIKDRQTKLADLVKFVQARIGEIESERNWAGVLNKFELVSKAIKATADAFIDLAATVTGKAGKEVQTAYGVASSIGTGGAQFATGQNGAAELAKGVLGYGAAKVTPAEMESLEECLSEFSKNTTNNFIDGLNGDADAVLKNLRNMGASCSAAGVESAVKKMFSNKKVGEKVGKTLGGGVNVVNALYTYDQELKKAVDEWAKNEDDLTYLDEGKRRLQAELRVLQQKLVELDSKLKACSAEMRGVA